jgi:hypothetical protein
LIFHLKNHYALIFALREWIVPPAELDSCASPSTASPSPFVDELRQTCSTASKFTGPRVVRQILCARKGQRPTAWVDFDEARETMLGWEGYKIMTLTLPAINCGMQQHCKEEFCRQLELDKESAHHTAVISVMNYLSLLPSHY